MGIAVTERDRDSTPSVPLHRFMVEVDSATLPKNHIYVGIQNGFDVVEPEQSVIYYSRTAMGMYSFLDCYAFTNGLLDTLEIELVVLRGIANNTLLDVAKGVVQTACSERRNVRVSSVIWCSIPILTMCSQLMRAPWYNLELIAVPDMRLYTVLRRVTVRNSTRQQ